MSESDINRVLRELADSQHEVAALWAERDRLRAVLNSILDDATGNQTPGRRLWPIRAENYRSAQAALAWWEGGK